MKLEYDFTPLALEAVHDKAAALKADGYRYVNTHAVNTETGTDIYYSFMKDGKLHNFVVENVQHDQQVRSISDLFLGCFPFENEMRELFDVDVSEIAIDFGGNMYSLAEKAPMTFMSPELKKEKDKQKKIALAKAAKARKAAAEAAKAKAEAEAAAAEAAASDNPEGPRAEGEEQ